MKMFIRAYAYLLVVHIGFLIAVEAPDNRLLQWKKTSGDTVWILKVLKVAPQNKEDTYRSAHIVAQDRVTKQATACITVSCLGEELESLDVAKICGLRAVPLDETIKEQGVGMIRQAMIVLSDIRDSSKISGTEKAHIMRAIEGYKLIQQGYTPDASIETNSLICGDSYRQLALVMPYEGENWIVNIVRARLSGKRKYYTARIFAKNATTGVASSILAYVTHIDRVLHESLITFNICGFAEKPKALSDSLQRGGLCMVKDATKALADTVHDPEHLSGEQSRNLVYAIEGCKAIQEACYVSKITS